MIKSVVDRHQWKMCGEAGPGNFYEPIPLVEPGGCPHGMDGPEPEIFYVCIAAVADNYVHEVLCDAPLLSPVAGVNEHLSDDAMRGPGALR